MTTASHPTTITGVPVDGSEAAEVADFRATQRARYERFHESIDRSAAGGFVTFMNLGYEPLAGEPDVSGRWVSLFGRRVRRAEQRLVAELIGDGALVGPALDVGCGRGGTLQLLNRVAPDVSVVGVDLSPGALGRARSFSPVVLADAEQLPVASGSCATAICIEMSLSAAWPNRVVAEIARALAPGGWLYLADVAFVSDDPTAELLDLLGFEAVCTRSIRENVMASCVRRAQRLAAGAPAVDPAATAVDPEFAFAPGSAAFRGFEVSALDYRLVTARRVGPRLSSQEASSIAARFDPFARRHQRRVLGIDASLRLPTG